MALCWKCGKSFILEPGAKLSFRASCDHCGAYLHVCKGCRFYSPGRRNDCLVPDTPPIADREMANFCEEFEPALKASSGPTENLSDVEKRLFGDDQSLKKKGFEDLF